MIPRCSPDSARMWEAPLFLNASVISGGISLRFPVSKAFIRALVLSVSKPIESVQVCKAATMCPVEPLADEFPVHNVSSVVAWIQKPVIKYNKTSSHILAVGFLPICHRISNINVVSINIDVPAAI